MDRKEEKTKELWDNSAPSYTSGIRRQMEDGSRGIWLDLILRNAPEKETLDVLDLGTGPGFFAIILALAGHRATGIDVSARMLENARENARAYGADAVFLPMNVQEPDFPENSFDLVVCRNVTWALYEPEKAYAAWKRILRPGGRLLIFDACWYNHFFDGAAMEDLDRRIRAYREKHGDLPPRFAMTQATNYMRQLALLGVERPLWDRAMLWKLRFEDIVCREDLNGEADRTDVDRMLYSAAPMFLVRGTKVTPERELSSDLERHWDLRAAMEGVLAVREAKGETSFFADFIRPLLPAPGAALDAGCGGGGTAVCLALGGWRVTAVDRSERMLAETRYTAQLAGASAETVCADLCAPLPFPDESFGLVLAHETLWCLTEPEQAFRELARVLKPGGTLIVSDSVKYAHMASGEAREAYAARWRDAAESSLRLIYGVTCSRATVIDDVWDRLPLSLRARPAWDRETAEALGLALTAQTEVPEAADRPAGFVLRFEKRREENIKEETR